MRIRIFFPFPFFPPSVPSVCARYRVRACPRDPQDCPVLIGLQMEELYYALYDFLTDLLLAAGNERARACVRESNEYEWGGCTEGFPFGSLEVDQRVGEDGKVLRAAEWDGWMDGWIEKERKWCWWKKISATEAVLTLLCCAWADRLIIQKKKNGDN